MRLLALALFTLIAGAVSARPAQELSTPQAGQANNSLPTQSATSSNTWLSAGTPGISLGAGQTLRISIAGATAAYAIDPLYVDVSVAEGVVQVVGKFGGHTQIVVVTGGSLRTIPVDITAAAPIYPPGFIAPEVTTTGPVTGAYETRYNSDQQQLQNILDLTAQGSNRTTEFHMAATELLTEQPGESRLFLSSGSYRTFNANWDLTLLDQSVVNSPLTLNGPIIRGLHFKSRRWIVHAGYVSLATFQGFILPIHAEETAGISYAIPLTTNSRLTSNFYYFFAAPNSLTTGNSGAIGSLLYEYKPLHGPELQAEIGVGNGVGGAVHFHHSTAHDNLLFDLLEKPREFHSLSFDNVPGVQSAFAWNRQLSLGLSNSVNVSENRFLLPGGQQGNFASTENLFVKLSRNWSAGTGATYSAFNQTGVTGPFSISSLTLPQSINFDSRHFGAAFQYQYTWNSQGFASGQDFRPSFRVSNGGFSASAYVEKQTQVTTIQAILADIPGLQAELEALGLAASTPQQLQALLQQSTFLQALGLSSGASLALVPVRYEVGGNLNWTSTHSANQQLNLGMLYTSDKSVLTASNNWNLNGSYVRRLGRDYNLSLSASLLHVTETGQPKIYPMAQISLRRTIGGLPGFLTRQKFGSVTGVIFQDDEGRGRFRKGLPPLPGVEIVLDGSERTVTDSNGVYSFTHVPEGRHFIEVNFHSEKPFWYTGPSKTGVALNMQNNLGICFASAELIGYLRSDAGVGVEGAHIFVTGARQRLEIQSDAQGRFSVPALGAGEYQVIVDANSFPAGYSLEELAPQQVALEDGNPQRVDFSVRALRSIVGQVTVYNPAIGEYVPAVAAQVELRELSRKIKTGTNGKFSFQDLPPGDFTVVLDWNGEKLVQQVTVPVQPSSLRLEIRVPYAKTSIASDGKQ